MKKISSLFQRIIEDSNYHPDVVSACENGEFYVLAIECLGGEQSIGCIEGPDENDIPFLHFTRDSALKELQDEIDCYANEIAEGDRDEDDEFEGRLLAAKWDGESQTMTLYEETVIANPPAQGDWRTIPIYEGNWRSMAGLGPEGN